MSLDSKRPFATRFAVVNQGPFSIYNLYYACRIGYLHTPSGYVVMRDKRRPVWIVAVPESKQELISKAAKWSVSCEIPSYMNAYMNINSLQPVVDKASLQIEVFFRPSFWPFHISRGGAFVMIRDHSGNAQWIFEGQALPIKDFDNLRQH